jgi:hypothetical protein
MRFVLFVASFSVAALGCGGSSPTPAAATASPAASSSSPPAAGSSAASAQALPASVDTGLSRVRALIDRPSRSAIDDGFSPDFLAQIPGDKVQALFDDVHRHMSGCSAPQVLSSDGIASAKVHLDCTGGGLIITIAVDAKPPYLITGLLIRPTS